ncbi:MAG TPA: hypothetical protein VEH27_14435 [Methylomirabilota bacterium]|nr:hypothetical protein [Methylomirabilota bacterium]
MDALNTIVARIQLTNAPLLFVLSRMLGRKQRDLARLIAEHQARRNEPQLSADTLDQMKATIWSGIRREQSTPPPTSVKMASDVPPTGGPEDGGGATFPPPGDAHSRCSPTGVDTNVFSPGGGITSVADDVRRLTK